MDLKNQNRLLAGLISERFPEVSGIIISMTYYKKGANPVLMERTINMLPTSDAYFKMDCMIRGCDGGGFDLTQTVADMRRTSGKQKKARSSVAIRSTRLRRTMRASTTKA